jgi:hypothetical protein
LAHRFSEEIVGIVHRKTSKVMQRPARCAVATSNDLEVVVDDLGLGEA